MSTAKIPLSQRQSYTKSLMSKIWNWPATSLFHMGKKQLATVSFPVYSS